MFVMQPPNDVLRVLRQPAVAKNPVVVFFENPANNFFQLARRHLITHQLVEKADQVTRVLDHPGCFDQFFILSIPTALLVLLCFVHFVLSVPLR